MTSPYPAAVLWDMDGTIVDTEPLWIAAEKALVERHGGAWTDADSLALVGSDLLVAGDYIRRRGDLPMSSAQVAEYLLGEVLDGVKAGVEWRPGARELLTELGAAGIPCALVTMSYQVLAEAVVAQLPPGTFEAVVTGDMVANGKPHPEPYRTAAETLGIEPERHGTCVVIEDSPTGAVAGLAAGMPVLAVPNTVEVPDQQGMVVIDSLAGLRAADLWATVTGGPGHGANSAR
nr:HAD family phosphatase [Phytoactinopolyspora halophila]